LTPHPCWICGTGATPTEDFLPALLCRCPECGFLFQPEREPEELHELYDGDYFEQYQGGAYDQHAAERRYEAAKRLRWVRKHRPTGRLLEIGSASGYFLAVAREAGYQAVGVEPAEAAAALARRRSGAEVLTGFVEDVELSAADFDVACAFHVLEHVADPLAALDRIRDALRPGGLLFLEVPNIASVQAQRDRGGWHALEPRYHVAHYAPGSMRELLVRGGFEVVRVDSFPIGGYYRPRRALHPGVLRWYMRCGARLLARPRGPHRWKHELLRAVARVPAPRG
jgi:SAM-dependent methyltransferase